MTVLYQICVILRCVIKGLHCTVLIFCELNKPSKFYIINAYFQTTSALFVLMGLHSHNLSIGSISLLSYTD